MIWCVHRECYCDACGERFSTPRVREQQPERNEFSHAVHQPFTAAMGMARHLNCAEIFDTELLHVCAADHVLQCLDAAACHSY